MPLLVKKFTFRGWPTGNVDEPGNIPADTIFEGGIKTKKNTLSCWRVPSRESFSDAVLAIVAPHTSLDAIDVVFLDEDSLKNGDVVLKNTPAKSYVDGVENTHVDLSELTVRSLSRVAHHTLQQVIGENFETISVGDLTRIFYEAKGAGRIKWDKLNENLRNALEAEAKLRNLA